MDVVSILSGAGDDIAGLRDHRRVAVEQTQLAYDLLLESGDGSSMSRLERWTVAAFVALLHGDARAADHYLGGVREVSADVALVVVRLAGEGAAAGPYGSYPAGPLSVEDVAGPDLAIDSDAAAALGDRLSAALRHAHRLVLHPRDAAPAWLEDLAIAGWDRPGIVTLSQLVSFLAYQLRLVAGLRALQEA